YDDQGRAVNSIVLNEKGALTLRLEYDYRPDGQMLENRHFNGHTGKTSRTINIFDEQDMKIRLEAYDGDGVLERKQLFLYDDNGKVREESTTYLKPEQQKSSTRTVNLRNDKGDMIAQTVYDADGKV